MDYSELSRPLVKKIMAAMAIINNPEIAPATRQLNQEILLREVGAAIYAKIYDMNAFDYELEGTRGPGIDDRYYGLAKVSAASVSTGALGLGLLVKNYVDHVTAKAQQDATKNARQSGKRTRVVRTLGRTEKTCEWCEGLAAGSPYEGSDIKAEIFGRHRGCDCLIITEGFKSRNGELKNYVKPKDS